MVGVAGSELIPDPANDSLVGLSLPIGRGRRTVSASNKDMVAEGGDCTCEGVRGDCAEERGCVGEKGGGTCWVGVGDGTWPAGDEGLSAVPGGG